jgi:hypothetical protein
MVSASYSMKNIYVGVLMHVLLHTIGVFMAVGIILSQI